MCGFGLPCGDPNCEFTPRKPLPKPHWKLVNGHGGDWYVVYNSHDRKVYEGHDINSNALEAILAEFGTTYKSYEFTDDDEIDGCTPNDFANIRGIKLLC
jgi:hypothetical protein